MSQSDCVNIEEREQKIMRNKQSSKARRESLGIVQLNIEVPIATHKHIKVLAAVEGVSINELLKPWIEERLKATKVKYPFNNPCPPLKSNVLTGGAGSSNFAAPTDGVLAQLVEHHNGIELVSSNDSPKVCKEKADSLSGVVKLGPNIFEVVSDNDVQLVAKNKLPRKYKELSLAE